jgi:hypothetical protein
LITITDKAQSLTHSLFLTLQACWYTIQFQWLAKESTRMEQLLHAILPLASASVLTNSVSMQMSHHWGIDRAATLAPYLFALLLAAGMRFLGLAVVAFDVALVGTASHAHYQLSTTNSQLVCIPG